jgi:aspartate/methionine/tyrosine aminotransferase
MKIRDFGVEIWMNRHDNNCELNIAETCVESLTVAELLEMAGKTDTILSELLPMKLTYGAIEGSERLRKLVAALYEKQAVENVVITHGAIGANALVHGTLVERGDRVISVLPTYQQHYSINNPNNPTGALMDRAYLEKVVEIARAAGAWILCDEVYRGTDQEGDGMTASIADLYEKGISTASMSKTFALAGLRLGWIAGPVDLLHAVSIHRDYNTISVGMLDDHFAAIALENRDKILARSRAITRSNLATLAAWVDGEPLVSWIKPKSGTTALLKYHLPLSSVEFCEGLLARTGVMLTPGSAMDMEGYVRIGFTNNGAVLAEGLKRISTFLREQQAAAA